MKNLLTLKTLSKQEISEILDLATDISKNKVKTKLTNKIVGNLFFEPSTRTNYSFWTAEEKLDCKIINFNNTASSTNKGESFYDTVKTFDMFGLSALVIRSSENKWYKQLENKISTPLINAGDGVCDHPTQTILDLMTIKNHFKKFDNLTVLIVGDISHSRVAHSNIDTFKKMGMKVLLSAPKEFQDKQFKYTDLDKAIKQADVINLLRIQNERLEKEIKINVAKYNKQYGFNSDRAKLMKPKAIIIHPAPFNRNVEINDDVVEHKQSKIFEQMKNGVFVRMAVLLKILGNK